MHGHTSSSAFRLCFGDYSHFFGNYSCRELRLQLRVWTRLNAIKCGRKNPERAGWGAVVAGEGEGTRHKHVWSRGVACHWLRRQVSAVTSSEQTNPVSIAE